jgi:hypothetical protein
MGKRPRIKGHGVGAKDIEFWLDGDASSSSAPKAEAGASKGKGKGKAQPKGPAPSGSGRYITVFDFFKTSMLFYLFIITTLTLYSIQHHPQTP